jgi:NTP pyrophosphatase (non-canonical NTP hydrolase)
LSALARLLEEVAELAELLAVPEPDNQEMGSELADLFVISTCLANQYCAFLDEEYTELGFSEYPDGIYAKAVITDAPLSVFLSLISRSGQIARIVNHYEGDKKKKATEKHKSLARAIAEFQITLFHLSKALQIPIVPKIGEVLNKSISRDKARFGISHDPVTEPSLERFAQVIEQTHCPFALSTKLWGSFEWDPSKSLKANIENSLPTLMRFCKCSEPEGLDVFVFEAYGDEYGATLTGVSRTTNQVLTVLSDLDPSGNKCMDADILNKDWQFSFNSQRFFISVFAPCYPPNHPRYSHSSKSTFIMFQPEFSFDIHGIHAGNPKLDKIKERIRKAFAANNSAYDVELIKQRLEAFLYIMPLNVGDPPVRWWEVGLDS